MIVSGYIKILYIGNQINVIMILSRISNDDDNHNSCIIITYVILIDI